MVEVEVTNTTPAPQFALAPTLHPQQAGFIDYGTKEGQKLFEITSAALGTEKKFDGRSDQLNIFKQFQKKGLNLQDGYKEIMTL